MGLRRRCEFGRRRRKGQSRPEVGFVVLKSDFGLIANALK